MKLIIFSLLLVCYLINSSEAITCQMCNGASAAGSTLSSYKCGTSAQSLSTFCGTCMTAARRVGSTNEIYKFCVPPNLGISTLISGYFTVNYFYIVENNIDSNISLVPVTDNTNFNIYTCATTNCNNFDISSSIKYKMNTLFILLASFILTLFKFY